MGKNTAVTLLHNNLVSDGQKWNWVVICSLLCHTLTNHDTEFLTILWCASYFLLRYAVMQSGRSLPVCERILLPHIYVRELRQAQKQKWYRDSTVSTTGYGLDDRVVGVELS